MPQALVDNVGKGLFFFTLPLPPYLRYNIERFEYQANGCKRLISYYAKYNATRHP